MEKNTRMILVDVMQYLYVNARSDDDLVDAKLLEVLGNFIEEIVAISYKNEEIILEDALFQAQHNQDVF